MNKTLLKYLEDTYVFEWTAQVIETGNNEIGDYILLDQTIFYPQGGGQPSDTWVITVWDTIYRVEKVRLDERWIVYHYGTYTNGFISKWQTVNLHIDKDIRLQNAKCHSAGHLIDIALSNIGEDLIPVKWYHFSDGPYVEYEGNPIRTLEDIAKLLQQELDILVRKNIPILVTYDNTTISSPEGKVPRYVSFEGYTGCGCGGTHIRSSGEIWAIEIRKVKIKDGKLRVSYSVK